MNSTTCPSPRCRGASVPIAEYLRHIRVKHSMEPMYFSCPLCPETNFRFKGLETHWYRSHTIQRKVMKLPPSDGQGGSSGQVAGIPCDSDMPHDIPSDIPSVIPNDIPSVIPNDIPSDPSDISSDILSDIPSDIVSDIPSDITSGPDTASELSKIGDSGKRSAPQGDSDLLGGEELRSGSEQVVDRYHEDDVSSDSDNDEGEVPIDSDIEGSCDESAGNSGGANSGSNAGKKPPECASRGAEFLLAMRIKCGVNKTQLMTVVNETKELNDFVFKSTIDKLDEAGIAMKNVDVDKLKADVCDSIFDKMQSTYLQEKFFYKEYDVVKPKFVQINQEFVRAGNAKKIKTVIVPKNFYYVPILQILKKLLSHPDYEAMSKRDVDSNPDVLDCYLKGSFAKDNPILILHNDALRLLLYYDDVEACRDLSSHSSGQQKLGAFYLTLDNIHPKYRASLSTITLVVLSNASFLKSGDGMDLVLKRVKMDLLALENGVNINGKVTYGTLIGFTGDNLGQHEVGGFKCGFTAHRLCHTCTATPQEVHNQVMEDPSMLRTVEDYTRQVAEIESAQTLGARDSLSREYGITRACVLNSLASFHVLSGLPPDLMHNVLEGSLARTVKFIIKYFVDSKIVTLQWLNETLKDFDYGYSERSTKPSRIKNDHLKEDGNLRQSASQMWTLACVLPLILGPHIEEKNANWKNFILLLEIMRMIFSSSIHKDLLPHLGEMIAEYLSGYKNLYGHLLPKDHFMIHIPRFLMCYGTLLDFMCMRMEAVHQFFKKQVYTVRNYKNIPKSLAITFQLYQAYKWRKPLIKATAFGKLTRLNISEVPYAEHLSGTDEVVESSWVSSEGFLIKSDCYICVGCDSASTLSLCRLQKSTP